MASVNTSDKLTFVNPADGWITLLDQEPSFVTITNPLVPTSSRPAVKKRGGRRALSLCRRCQPFSQLSRRSMTRVPGLALTLLLGGGG